MCLRKSVAWQGSTTYQLRTGRGLMGSHDAGPGWGAVCPPGQVGHVGENTGAGGELSGAL